MGFRLCAVSATGTLVYPGRSSCVVSWTRPPSFTLKRHRSSAFRYDTNDITAYKVAANVICRRAMSPEDSARLIADMLNEVENT